MTIRLRCAECKRKLKVPDAALGKKVQCPVCGARFRGRIEPVPPPFLPPLSPAPPAAAPFREFPPPLAAEMPGTSEWPVVPPRDEALPLVPDVAERTPPLEPLLETPAEPAFFPPVAPAAGFPIELQSTPETKAESTAAVSAPETEPPAAPPVFTIAEPEPTPIVEPLALIPPEPEPVPPVESLTEMPTEALVLPPAEERETSAVEPEQVLTAPKEPAAIDTPVVELVPEPRTLLPAADSSEGSPVELQPTIETKTDSIAADAIPEAPPLVETSALNIAEPVQASPIEASASIPPPKAEPVHTVESVAEMPAEPPSVLLEKEPEVIAVEPEQIPTVPTEPAAINTPEVELVPEPRTLLPVTELPEVFPVASQATIEATPDGIPEAPPLVETPALHTAVPMQAPPIEASASIPSESEPVHATGSAVELPAEVPNTAPEKEPEQTSSTPADPAAINGPLAESIPEPLMTLLPSTDPAEESPAASQLTLEAKTDSTVPDSIPEAPLLIEAPALSTVELPQASPIESLASIPSEPEPVHAAGWAAELPAEVLSVPPEKEPETIAVEPEQVPMAPQEPTAINAPEVELVPEPRMLFPATELPEVFPVASQATIKAAADNPTPDGIPEAPPLVETPELNTAEPMQAATAELQASIPSKPDPVHAAGSAVELPAEVPSAAPEKEPEQTLSTPADPAAINGPLAESIPEPLTLLSPTELPEVSPVASQSTIEAATDSAAPDGIPEAPPFVETPALSTVEPPQISPIELQASIPSESEPVHRVGMLTELPADVQSVPPEKESEIIAVEPNRTPSIPAEPAAINGPLAGSIPEPLTLLPPTDSSEESPVASHQTIEAATDSTTPDGIPEAPPLIETPALSMVEPPQASPAELQASIPSEPEPVRTVGALTELPAEPPSVPHEKEPEIIAVEPNRTPSAPIEPAARAPEVEPAPKPMTLPSPEAERPPLIEAKPAFAPEPVAAAADKPAADIRSQPATAALPPLSFTTTTISTSDLRPPIRVPQAPPVVPPAVKFPPSGRRGPALRPPPQPRGPLVDVLFEQMARNPSPTDRPVFSPLPPTKAPPPRPQSERGEPRREPAGAEIITIEPIDPKLLDKQAPPNELVEISAVDPIVAAEKSQPQRPNTRKARRLGWTAGILAIFLLASAVIGCAVYSWMNADIPSGEWVIFQTPDRVCSVSMPGTPTLTPNGNPRHPEYILSRPQDQLTFVVEFTDVVAAASPPNLDEIVRREIDLRIRASGGSEIALVPVASGAIKGREFQIRRANAELAIARLFVVPIGPGHRIYQATASGSSERIADGQAARFLRSLSFTPGRATGSPPEGAARN